MDAREATGGTFERLLLELMQQAAEEGARRALEEVARQPEPAKSQTTPSGDLIEGVDPYALYSVPFVAKRWGVSNDYVRRIPESELPRTPWKGSEIRYRGSAILSFEGIDVPDARIYKLPAAGKAPEPSRKKRRIYARNLPTL